MGEMRLKRPTVQGFSKTIRGASWAALCLFGASALAEEYVPTTSVVISVAEQKLAILKDGGLIKKYPISTSKFGLGDAFGSYKTPLGRMRVCQKIGDDLSPGAVFKQRHATGEVLPVNAPGRDPIVTRIIWLEGLEAQNANARGRGIYIHGTVEESKIGEAVSYGCIRMRSKDVVEVFDEVPLDTTVTITADKFPRYAKYTPPKPAKVIVAANPPAKPETPAPEKTAVAKTPVETPASADVAQVKLPPGKSTKVEATNNPAASLALKGSILDAGLPEGPKIPTLPSPPEPKDVPRFSTFTPNQASESAFSLQGISRDLSPVIRAADTDATARETAARQAAAKGEAKAPPGNAETKPAETTEPTSKPRVAFRSGTSATKPKR